MIDLRPFTTALLLTAAMAASAHFEEGEPDHHVGAARAVDSSPKHPVSDRKLPVTATRIDVERAGL